MTVFAYPKSKHTRTLSPGPFSSYRSYKPALRTEFSARCVYCRQPDSIKGSSAFGVDHYRPQHRFSSLSTEYLNLYYCCNACNCYKGRYWPAPRLELTAFIPNPCEYVMFEHLRFAGPRVEARTAPGRFTEELLKLNDESTVVWRKAVLTAVEVLIAQESRLTRLLLAIAKRQKAGTISSAKAADDSAKATAMLQETRASLAMHTGELQAP